jgi:hypothetical protein
MSKIQTIKQANQFAGTLGLLMDNSHSEYAQICKSEDITDPYIVVNRGVQPARILTTFGNLPQALAYYQQYADGQ